MSRFVVFLAALLLALAPAAAQDKKKSLPKIEPRVILSVPLGAAPGKTTKLTLRGVNLDTTKEVKLDAAIGAVKILSKGKAAIPDKNPDKVGDTQVEIEMKLNDKLPGESITLTVVTANGETKPHTILIAPVVAEKESNDGFKNAQPITVPTTIEGTIGRPKDVDVCRFEGKKGQKVSADVLASRHGSPFDAILTLYDAKGEPLASNDDFTKEHRDAKVEMTLPADGVYYLSLLDAHDSGSNLHVYRLVVK